MQKLFKNWIFTLITCILLALLAVVMLLGAFELKGFSLAGDILHLLAAVILALYIVFVLFPLVARYRGTVQVFVGVEVLLLVLAVVALAFAQLNVPFFSALQVCSVVGLAMWLRGAVEIVHAYTLQGRDGAKKPLWQLCLYILLCALGVWQIARPTIADKHFLFVTGVAAVIMASIFGYATAQNRRALGVKRPKKPKKGKKEEADETALVLSEDK